jgi:4-amino-4-deoxy-L-arabinose transferase-like glycosyltransferase
VRASAVALEALGLVSLLALAGALFHHGLVDPPDFDEGVYLAAVDAWRHGQALGSEIFTAQPPGFYTLLRAGQALFGATIAGGRDTIVALALLGLAGAYALGRAYGGVAVGLGAAALLAVAPPYPTFAGRVSADLPSFALGLLALALLLNGLRRRSEVATALAGALAVAALSVKVSAVTLLVPLVGYAIAERARLRDAAAFLVGALAVAAGFLIGFHGDLGGIWHGAVGYHEQARGAGGPGLSDNLHRIGHFLDPHTPFAWLVVAAVAVSASPWRPRPAARIWPLWAWSVTAAAFLAWHRPLHDNHMVLLAVTLALPSGIVLGSAFRGRPVLVAALALALAAAFTQEYRRSSRNAHPIAAEIRWAAAEVDRRTAPGEEIVTDQPLVAVLAHRRIPGQLVDAAALRFDSGLLRDADVLAGVDRAHVRVVVVDRVFRIRPAILAGLERRFPTRVRRGELVLYAR